MQGSARAPDKGGLLRPPSSAQQLTEHRQVDDVQSRPAWLSPVSPQGQQAVVVWNCCWGGLTHGGRSKEATSHQVHPQDPPRVEASGSDGKWWFWRTHSWPAGGHGCEGVGRSPDATEKVHQRPHVPLICPSR